jgi:hypothetical protein
MNHYMDGECNVRRNLVPASSLYQDNISLSLSSSGLDIGLEAAAQHSSRLQIVISGGKVRSRR